MPPKQKTKADLKQAVDQLTEKLRAAEARLDADVEAERDEALERADEAERRVLDLEQEIGQLKKDLEGTTDHAASEVEREVKTRLKRAESDLAGSEEHVRQLELELDDARDEVDRLEWKLESAERDAELQAARVREQAQRDHRKELEARDELIALLKEKLSRRQNEPKAMDTEAPPPSSSTGSGCTPDPQHKKETVPVANSGRTVRLSLPTLPTFSGEECRDDEDLFERWVRKLEKYAELESWSDREKLVQLELRLKGRAERLFEVLPSESKSSFKSAVEGLKKRLAPARRDALLSAQLMKRKQLPSESVDQYAQEFETLFDRSYGRRSGMDQESKDLLKRDLFVLGLKMKWQEKVLPSAKTFADSLHQARAAEEQERQLNELHKPPGSSSSAATPSSSADRGSNTSRTGHSSNSSRFPRCRECGSTRHKQRDCPQRRPPSETPARENTRSGSSSAVKAARVTRGEESLDDQCRRLADQLAEAEYQRMSKSYSSNAAVDAVTGSLGPLYYATVTVGGTPVEGMVDPGSSATIMSFNLFQKIGRRAGILKEALKPLDSGLVLRDYSQRPIPIGACVELTFEWGGKSVTSTVFLRSDLGVGGEPCLLGTNVVIPLGLMVPGPGVEPRGGDRSPTVCFIQPKRVPGGGAVIIKAKLPNSTPSTDSVFFQPNQRWMADTGLKIEESVVQPDDEGCVHLLVQNPSRDTHKLSIGTPVGQLESCVEISPGELVNDETNEEPVGLVNRIDDNVQKERVEKLKEMLRVSEEGLTQDEQKRVRDFVLEQSRFTIQDGVLFYVDVARENSLRVAVPSNSQRKLLEEIHGGSLSGHFAARSMYNTLARRYWWEGMYGDVHCYCRACLTCASHNGTGRRHRAPLQPIPVSGPFERVGVDIMKMPLTERGNQYVIVFMDYLTKWVEAYATEDQTSETIARLLVDNIVCRHGVPAELLSDRGQNLLSGLMQEVCNLLGMHKINTTAYHPQCDGLVENFNRTLQTMLAKHAKEFGPSWDVHLQQVLFAYRARPHSSTGESPFYMVYGRDSRLPTETAFSETRTQYQVDAEDYCAELTRGLTKTWQVAKQNIGKAQQRQKVQYDKHSKEPKYQVAGRVMVFMPHEKTDKLSLPYHGPYRIVEVLTNGLSVRPVDKPNMKPILVNVDRVTPCPPELADESWLGPKKERKRARTRYNLRK